MYTPKEEVIRKVLTAMQLLDNLGETRLDMDMIHHGMMWPLYTRALGSTMKLLQYLQEELPEGK